MITPWSIMCVPIKKITIGCPDHGWFKQTPLRHYSGHGCKACAMLITNKARAAEQIERRKAGTARPHRKANFITEALALHGNRYDYSETQYTAYHEPVIIICQKHGRFEQKPSKHLSAKRGCPKCGRQESKIATEWLNSLAVPIREYRIPECRRRVVDGYDPNTKTIYQFHGDFFHGNPKLYKPDQVNPLTRETFGVAFQRTVKLDQELRDLGYNLVLTWESDYRGKRKGG